MISFCLHDFCNLTKIPCSSRCRHGYFHVVNNDYTHWEMYAIGGSAAPTINSQGNRFLAPDRTENKEVRIRVHYIKGNILSVT